MSQFGIYFFSGFFIFCLIFVPLTVGAMRQDLDNVVFKNHFQQWKDGLVTLAVATVPAILVGLIIFAIFKFA